MSQLAGRYQEHGLVEPGGELIIKNMNPSFRFCYNYFAFATDPEFKNLVVPAGGSINLEASEDGFYFGKFANSEGILVNTQDYKRTQVEGCIESIKATIVIPIVPPVLLQPLYWKVWCARYR